MSRAKELTKQLLRQFVDSFDTILFDCDGVLWQSNDVISKTPALIAKLRDMGKQPLFVTNNSTKSRRQYMEKFAKLGFKVSENEIFCTAYLAAIYLRNILNFQGKAYLIGSPGMQEEFKLFDINYTGTGPDPVAGEVEDWVKIPLDPEIKAVVIGQDVQFSYKKILLAATYIRDRTVSFVATDHEGRHPHGAAKIVEPGTGSIVSAVETAAGRDALVLGKPHKFMVDLIKEKFTLEPRRTVMVGDRLNTDIQLGKNADLHTLLVLTGVSKLSDVDSNLESSDPTDRECIPDYYIESLTKLTEYLSDF
ncbi:putative phosphoglycolate phosphatase [Apostichopus japonicus]|uniref:Putative phosphoglycolate phosphatase n=1 Tax=Stichopus japonicus TaxID=307972 RepID=A0A2G8L404_STIJA|nr:putative phosphoglycolate phosphatase [Apostichopus japonicus]